MASKKVMRYTLEVLILLVVGGIYLYLNKSATSKFPGKWENIHGPTGKIVTSLFWEAESGDLLSGSNISEDDAGIGRYSSKETWSYPVSGLPKDHRISGIFKVGNEIWVLYFSTEDEPGGIIASEDGGKTWKKTITVDDVKDPRCLVIAKDNRILLGTIGKGIYSSDDEGKTWKPSMDGLDNLWVQCMSANPFHREIILTGTLTGLFRSRDNGNHWEAVTEGIGNGDFIVVDIEADPLNDGHFLAITRGAHGDARVIASFDGGRSWQRSQEGLPMGVQPRCFAFHPKKRNVVFLGTVYDGVFRSDDGGKQWNSMNTNLPVDKRYIIVHSLLVSPTDDAVLYAGTDLDGEIWKYRLE